MADDQQHLDRISAALRDLQLRYTYEPRSSGPGLWHVPFDLGAQKPATLTVFLGPVAAGVLCVVGDVSKGWQPPDSIGLLRLNADLALTKMVIHENLVSVTAEIPADQINVSTLRIAVGNVLEGVRRIRGIQSEAAVEPATDHVVS